jgi:exosortase A-associated hydrolase 2
MNERVFFFPSGAYRLLGVFHEPAAGVARRPFVFCHPFAEEKLWAHRVFVTFARALARRGHPVLRFDVRGCGDSSGDFSEFSIEGAVSDGMRAVETLRELTKSPEVGLLGLRLGASIASRIADARDDVADLVLWAPIVDGARYMQELLRINLATQLAVYKEIRADRAALVRSLQEGRTVNIDGYAVALPFYEQLMAVRLAEREGRFGGGCLIAQLDPRAEAPRAPDVEKLAARYPGGTVVSVMEEPFWKEIPRFYDEAPNLFPATLAWLEARCGA